MAHRGAVDDGTSTAETSVRERLLRVAADIFSRKGYAASSVGEIVAAAGVTKPVLYYHFESKAGLYLALVNGALGTLRPEVEAALRSDGRSAADRIRGLCDAIVRTALENLGTVRLMRALHYAPPQEAPELDLWEFPLAVQAALERIVGDGVRAREFAPARARGLAWAILGLVNVCVDSNLFHPKIGLKPDGFRSALDLVLAGAAPPAARRGAPGAQRLPPHPERQGES